MKARGDVKAGPVVEPSDQRKDDPSEAEEFASFPAEVLALVDSRPGTKRRASIVSKVFSSLQDEAQHKAVWITGILFLAENPGIDKLRTEIGHRLLAMPRFRSRVSRRSIFRGTYFTEMDIADIDMNYHFQTILDDDENAPPTREDVLAYVSTMYDSWMPDLDRPLWQILFVPRTQDDGAVLITRISHVIGDGVSQVEILMRMIDAEAKDESAAGVKGELMRPPPKRKPARIFGPLNSAAIFVKGLYVGATAILRSPDPPNSLQHGRGGVTSLRRNFAFTEKIALARIKAIKDKLEGATVNDVLMLMLNETLCRYFEGTGEKASLKGGRVSSQFPISTRRRNAEAFRGDDPCNSIAFGVIKFHLSDGGSMLDRFWRIKRDVDVLKLSPAPFLQIGVIRKLAPILPSSILNKFSLAVGDLATGQLSNVAAPQKPVYIAGSRVDDMSFTMLAPVALYMGLLSYNGQVNCTVCLSGDLEADPAAVVAHWGEVFADFEQEVMAVDGVVARPRYFVDCL